MDLNSFFKANEKMERIFGEKMAVLHDLLLHHKPVAVLKDNVNVSVIVYRDDISLFILPFGKDYIGVLRVSDELSEKLKIPSAIVTLIPNDMVDITNPYDVAETFLTSIQADLTDFLR